MNQSQSNQLEVALKELKKVNDKYDKLYREFSMMKLYSKDLEEKIRELTIPNKTKQVNRILSEADESMRKFTDKIRKECEKYAKQEQGEG